MPSGRIYVFNNLSTESSGHMELGIQLVPPSVLLINGADELEIRRN